MVSWVCLVAFAGGAIVQRLTESTPGEILGYAPSAARATAWLAAGPIALAAAHRRAATDEAEGVDAFAATFGVARSPMDLGRGAAAMLACTRAIAIPSLGTALLATALAGTPRLALESAGLLPAIAAFSIVSGVCLGAAATLADRLSPERGRSTLAAMVLLPWLLADAAGWHGASLPGALEAFLRTALGVVGLEHVA